MPYCQFGVAGPRSAYQYGTAGNHQTPYAGAIHRPRPERPGSRGRAKRLTIARDLIAARASPWFGIVLFLTSEAHFFARLKTSNSPSGERVKADSWYALFTTEPRFTGSPQGSFTVARLAT